jgi:uncharacterized membrane protein
VANSDRPPGAEEGPKRSTTLAVIAIFSALITVGTVVAIPLPFPLYEITFSPPIYLALATMVDTATAFDATVIGGFIGEAINISFRGGSPIYPFGMVWARGPEVFIVAWARNKGERKLAWAMAAATVFETLAFFFPDWAFYLYGLFQYGSPTNVTMAFLYASSDFGTLVDLAFIPVAILIIRRAGPAFKRLGFQ